MRKLSAIFLLLLLLVNGVGLHAIYMLQREQVKQEMKAYLKSNIHPDVETLSFTNERFGDIAWEDEKEFYLNGQIYDVIDITCNEHTTLVRCIPDKKETALTNSLYKHTKEESNEKAKAWIKLLTLPFDAVCSPTTFVHFTASIHYPRYLAKSITDRTSELLKPPCFKV